ncbi:putative phosphotransferase system enzyme IIB component, partial [Gordonia hirsuta DSM 44140 = NBRC 16056]
TPTVVRGDGGGGAGAGAGGADAGTHRRTNNKILTVCGNGVGTSLFLKNTLEKVLGEWGWSPFIEVEATDTISAKGKAKEADLILTSGEIAKALGDLGVPMTVIENFTSTAEIDAALRANYDI